MPGCLRHRAPLLCFGADVKAPRRGHDSAGSPLCAQLQTFTPTSSGIRTSMTTRTPRRTVSWLRRITPSRSRKVNVFVTRPAAR